MRSSEIRSCPGRASRGNSGDCYVVYSAAREMDDGTWRNSSTLIDRQGQIVGAYNKNHVVIEETTVEDMIREFQIERLDDYMTRALAHRHKAGNME